MAHPNSDGSLANAFDVDLVHLPLDEPVSGAPTAGVLVLDDFKGVSIGVWEMSPGVAQDSEEDEIFVVLAGRADVEFLDSGETLSLVPGVVGRLQSGQRTRWTVHETLRKIYLS